MKHLADWSMAKAGRRVVVRATQVDERASGQWVAVGMENGAPVARGYGDDNQQAMAMLQQKLFERERTRATPGRTVATNVTRTTNNQRALTLDELRRRVTNEEAGRTIRRVMGGGAPYGTKV